MCTKNFRSIGAGIVEKRRHKAVLSSFSTMTKKMVFGVGGGGNPESGAAATKVVEGGYNRACTCKSWAISVQGYLSMAMKCKFVGMFVDNKKYVFSCRGGVTQAINSYFVRCGG